MTHFYLKRFYYAVLQRRFWLLLSVLIAIVYLGFSASRVNRYIIHQDISITPATSFSVSSSPTDYISINDLISRPKDFFLEQTAVKILRSQLDYESLAKVPALSTSEMVNRIKKEMSLSRISSQTLRVRCTSLDRENAELFVSFYAGRLVRKAAEGLRRKTAQKLAPGLNRSDIPESQQATPSATLIGPAVITEERAYITTGRVFISLALLMGSSIIIIGLIVLIEFTDSSFKSERQIVRYLGLKSMGTVPDLNKITLSSKNNQLRS